jgi:hypothetical protein
MLATKEATGDKTLMPSALTLLLKLELLQTTAKLTKNTPQLIIRFSLQVMEFPAS